MTATTLKFDKGRLQSLSDGVFAIVMTLLVLDLIEDDVLNAVSARELHGALLALWPKVISYAVSFAVAARYWVAQHVMTHYVAHTDLRFIWLNILFLFWISLLPFSAALLGEHHRYAVAEIVYGLNMLLIILSLNACWGYATRQAGLSAGDKAPDFLRKVRRRRLLAPLVYVLGILASPVNPHLTYAIYVGVAVLSVVMSGLDKRSLPL